MHEPAHLAGTGGKDKAFLILGAVFFGALGGCLALSVGIGVWPLNGSFMWRAVLALAVPGGLCLLAARQRTLLARRTWVVISVAAAGPVVSFFMATALVMYPWREAIAARAVRTVRTVAEERAAYRAIWQTDSWEMICYDARGDEIRPWQTGDYSGVARAEFLWADGWEVAAPVLDGSDLEILRQDHVEHVPMKALLWACGTLGVLGLIVLPGWLPRRRVYQGRGFEVLSREKAR